MSDKDETVKLADVERAIINFDQGGGELDVWQRDQLVSIVRALPRQDGLRGAMEDVAAERRRQVEQEGFDDEHDAAHNDGEIARAAAAYALAGGMSDWARDARTKNEKLLDQYSNGRFTRLREIWPWDWIWWKPKDRRRDLVRAGALIIAEIERLDRGRAALAESEK